MQLWLKITGGCHKLTPTVPFVDRNCSSGSRPITLSLIVPKITAFQMRNRTRGIPVPRIIALLQEKARRYLKLYKTSNRQYNKY